MRTRLGKTLDRLEVEFDANRRERAEMRDFMRELLLRFERSMDGVVNALEAQAAELAEGRDQLRASTAATWAMVDEIRGTSR
jgi:hypothetical protein